MSTLCQEIAYTRHNLTCVRSDGSHGEFLYFPASDPAHCEMMCSQRRLAENIGHGSRIEGSIHPLHVHWISGHDCHGFSVMRPEVDCFLWLEGPLMPATSSEQMDCNIKDQVRVVKLLATRLGWNCGSCEFGRASFCPARSRRGVTSD